ncbi:hypothetical protein LTR78_001703 [Recurvomyces mirabilis]|uniref:Rhodopsin domain-containing protein n=1 Tax=Recurvomyces mirabilis TaxID=574656 RepID=A0AAE0WV60_9PEZI|nr:hypothetical protein LTR78_001703 [Recurvomyces mirabilis]KAK5150223.1 hypothetical protein LTS14_010352 [Recurvomyces mirabilis]
MTSTQAYHDTEFLKEVWGLYAVGVTVLLLRSAIRVRTVGLRGFQGDDYVSILVLLCYTADAVTVDLTFHYGSNVDYSPAKLVGFNQQQIDQIIFGSRCQLAAWYTYTMLVWALKACMLFFFNRLTLGLDSHTWVKRLAIACGITYAAVFLTITLGCRPFHHNWQTLPYPPPQCTLRAQNMYVSTILNVLTDAAMLAIPVPLLWKLQVPMKRKLALAAMFSSGMFVIIAAIVRITMTLKAHPSALTINRWGVRETIAGIIAVNVPILRPMFTKAFWKGNHPPSHPTTRKGVSTSGGKSGSSGGILSFRKTAAFEMVDSPEQRLADKDPSTVTMSSHKHNNVDVDSDCNEDASSQDFIVHKPGGPLSSDTTQREPAEDVEKGWAGVRVDTSYEVRPMSQTAVEDNTAAHQANAHGPRSWEADHPWSQGWRTRGHGHSVNIR